MIYRCSFFNLHIFFYLPITISQKQLCKHHIAMLYYMKGENTHSKDACEFLLHDLKHMELFAQTDIHYEQVGFFKCMLKLERDVRRSIHSGFNFTNDSSNNDSKNKPTVNADIDNNNNNDNSNSDDNYDRSELVVCNVSSSSISSITATIGSSDIPPPASSSCCPLQSFFASLGYDQLLYRELEYVISDM